MRLSPQASATRSDACAFDMLRLIATEIHQMHGSTKAEKRMQGGCSRGLLCHVRETRVRHKVGCHHLPDWRIPTDRSSDPMKCQRGPHLPSLRLVQGGGGEHHGRHGPGLSDSCISTFCSYGRARINSNLLHPLSVFCKGECTSKLMAPLCFRSDWTAEGGGGAVCIAFARQSPTRSPVPAATPRYPWLREVGSFSINFFGLSFCLCRSVFVLLSSS